MDKLKIFFVVTMLAGLSPQLLTGQNHIVLAQTNTQKNLAEKNIIANWYKLLLELVRHTATYSPPVAARAFAYLGITLHEAIAAMPDKNENGKTLASNTLVGQLNGLKSLPRPWLGQTYDRSVVLETIMATSIKNFFGNTGPTGLRAFAAMQARLDKQMKAGNISKDVFFRSQKYGQDLSAKIFAWSQTDGGANITNLGFPERFLPSSDPAAWKPTSTIGLQQAPLLPTWGDNRPLAMKHSDTCSIAAPPNYSEDPSSDFYKEATEVLQTSLTLTPEQKATARFWSDDPMLSPTPPGHWVSIVTEIFANQDYPIEKIAQTYASLGVAINDAFIGCWNAKYQYNLLRPVTYIRRALKNPKWESLLITPPFPEYPSGHSVQSGAAATVLTKIFGENFSFTDSTHADDGLTPRNYKNFWQAANEAAISRLYGGIHFRSAIEQGLLQGKCIGEKTAALKF